MPTSRTLLLHNIPLRWSDTYLVDILRQTVGEIERLEIPVGLPPSRGTKARVVTFPTVTLACYARYILTRHSFLNSVQLFAQPVDVLEEVPQEATALTTPGQPVLFQYSPSGEPIVTHVEPEATLIPLRLVV